jgi:hypothetical protein
MSSRHSVAIISSWKVEASCRPASGACPPISARARKCENYQVKTGVKHN